MVILSSPVTSINFQHSQLLPYTKAQCAIWFVQFIPDHRLRLTVPVRGTASSPYRSTSYTTAVTPHSHRMQLEFSHTLHFKFLHVHHQQFLRLKVPSRTTVRVYFVSFCFALLNIGLRGLVLLSFPALVHPETSRRKRMHAVLNHDKCSAYQQHLTLLQVSETGSLCHAGLFTLSRPAILSSRFLQHQRQRRF